MTIGNRLNRAIVSYMLKEHKKTRIMTYIADNHTFIPPYQISCQTRYTLHFIKPLRRSTGLLPKGMPLALDWHGATRKHTNKFSTKTQ